jgi:hypothetical protein
MENSFYIKTKNKHIYQRVSYAEVVMCDVWANGVRIHLADKPYLWVEATVDTLYDLFFRKNKSFIRASAGFIVNTEHILSAERRIGEMKLSLTDKKEAILRTGHDYAYFIQNNRRPDEADIQDTPQKDEIICAGGDVNATIQRIKEATGETVNRKYIVRRFKELSI